MLEIWLPIDAFPQYEVSNYGRVKSLKHNKILKPYDDGKGYDKVDLYNESKRYTKSVHRLVAETFLVDDEKLEINHIDGNKKNNSLSNLEWSTRSGNMLHAYSNGLKKPPSFHPHQRKVRIVETAEEFSTLNDCARHIHGDARHITSCLNGKRLTHKGYHFEVIE